MFTPNKYFSMKLVSSELFRRTISYMPLPHNDLSVQKGVARKQRFIFG